MTLEVDVHIKNAHQIFALSQRYYGDKNNQSLVQNFTLHYGESENQTAIVKCTIEKDEGKDL